MHRVARPNGRVGDPVTDSRATRHRLGEEPRSVASRTIEQRDDGQRVQRRVEVQREEVGAVATGAEHVLALGDLFEEPQGDVVRQEVRVVDGADRIDGDGIFPRRILSGGEAEGGRHGGVEEGDGLAGLIEAIIPIGVGQGVEAIRTGGDVADREASAIVRL